MRCPASEVPVDLHTAALLSQLRSRHVSKTTADCRARQSPVHCSKLHFKRVIQPWTDPSLGNCSYLDTCRNMRNCKYIHYIIDDDQAEEHQGPSSAQQLIARSKAKVPSYLQVCWSTL